MATQPDDARARELAEAELTEEAASLLNGGDWALIEVYEYTRLQALARRVFRQRMAEIDRVGEDWTMERCVRIWAALWKEPSPLTLTEEEHGELNNLVDLSDGFWVFDPQRGRPIILPIAVWRERYAALRGGSEAGDATDENAGPPA